MRPGLRLRWRGHCAPIPTGGHTCSIFTCNATALVPPRSGIRRSLLRICGPGRCDMRVLIIIKVSFLICIGAVVLSSFGLAQEGRSPGGNPLPAGPGRDIVAVACSQCHGLSAFTWLRQGEQAWRHQVYDMILRGTQIGRSEIDTVVTYLTTNFGPGVNVPPSDPVNLPAGTAKGSSKAAAESATASIALLARDVRRANGRRSSPDGFPRRAALGRSGKRRRRLSEHQFR